MSFYATLVGELTYSRKEDFFKACELLRKGGWIDREGYFLDAYDSRMSEAPTVDAIAQAIDIPLGLYRNLSHLIDELFNGAKGTVVGTSSDGCCDRWVVEDGKETTYELEQWAKENGLEEAPDVETDWENWSEWYNEVEQHFVETYGP